MCDSFYAQNKDRPEVGVGELKFYLDQSSFMGKGDSTYHEFSLMVYADQLKIVNKNDKQTAVLKIKTEISNSSNEVISRKNWITEVGFDKIDNIRTLVVYDNWGEMLIPGEYELKLTVSDMEKEVNGKLNSKFSVPAIIVNRIGVSGIKFVNKIYEKGEDENSNKALIPNPSRRYGLLNPLLQFYFEVYIELPIQIKTLVAEYIVKDSAGKIVKSLSGIDLKLAGSNSGFTQAIDISKLNTGLYNFEIIITDAVQNATVSVNRNFEILQADYLTKNIFVTKEDSEVIEKILKYITTPAQLKTYLELSSGGKAHFLLNFFKDLDPTPGTTENEILNELISRYHYVNLKFGWSKTEGWNTERGRIFIQNGKPDEVDRHEFDAADRPYEIWYYRKEREIMYVFADIRNNGNYILVHSNKEGEIFNSNWKLLVNKF